MAFTYLTVEQWLLWIRSSEAVDQTNDLPEEWTVNQSFLQSRLEAASSRVNNALATGGWITPLPAPYPPSVVDACGWIAWWGCELYGEIRESVQTHYESTEKWLEQLALGAIVLTDADGVAIPKATVPAPGEGRYTGHSFVGNRVALNPWSRDWTLRRLY